MKTYPCRDSGTFSHRPKCLSMTRRLELFFTAICIARFVPAASHLSDRHVGGDRPLISDICS